MLGYLKKLIANLRPEPRVPQPDLLEWKDYLREKYGISKTESD